MPLLNTATKVYAGSSLAAKVYRGTVQVWPPATAYGPGQSAYGAETPAGTVQWGVGALGCDVIFAVAGRITGMRYYWMATSADTSKTLRVWSSGGVLLGSVVVPRGTAGSVGWQQAIFTTPIAVTASQTVRAAVDSTTNDNMARSGVIGADAVYGDVRRLVQGYSGTGGTYPNTTTPRHYFADIIFEKAL